MRHRAYAPRNEHPRHTALSVRRGGERARAVRRRTHGGRDRRVGGCRADRQRRPLSCGAAHRRHGASGFERADRARDRARDRRLARRCLHRGGQPGRRLPLPSCGRLRELRRTRRRPALRGAEMGRHGGGGHREHLRRGPHRGGRRRARRRQKRQRDLRYGTLPGRRLEKRRGHKLQPLGHLRADRPRRGAARRRRARYRTHA